MSTTLGYLPQAPLCYTIVGYTQPTPEDPMMIYNVSIPIVALVEARSPRDAIARLHRAIKEGLDDYDIDNAHAFESEELPEGTEVLR